MRGDIYELKADPHAKGHEQQGKRYAVVLQSDALRFSTAVAAPTTTGDWESSFHPVIKFNGRRARVLVEQMRSVDTDRRFGRKVGRLTADEQQDVDHALRLVLGLF